MQYCHIFKDVLDRVKAHFMLFVSVTKRYLKACCTIFTEENLLIVILTVTVDYDIINYSYGFCAPICNNCPIYNSRSFNL